MTYSLAICRFNNRFFLEDKQQRERERERMSKDDECLSYTEILNGMRKACIPKPKVKCLFGNINLKKDGIVEAIDKKKAFPTTATSGLWLTSGKW